MTAQELLEADAKAREAMIAEAERQLHLAKQFSRYTKSLKLCSNPKMREMLERCRMQTIRLMEHQHV